MGSRTPAESLECGPGRAVGVCRVATAPSRAKRQTAMLQGRRLHLRDHRPFRASDDLSTKTTRWWRGSFSRRSRTVSMPPRSCASAKRWKSGRRGQMGAELFPPQLAAVLDVSGRESPSSRPWLRMNRCGRSAPARTRHPQQAQEVHAHIRSDVAARDARYRRGRFTGCVRRQREGDECPKTSSPCRMSTAA